MWKDLLTVALTAIVSLAELFILCKLMGNKQISQLSMFDYIIGISIGSIAAELATEIENPLYPGLAMLIYALVAFAISVWTSRLVWLRKAMTGKAIVLLDNGVIERENMKKARLDLSDFLTLCRISGYFDVSDIQTAIFEENGTISFLPKAEARPLIPRDVQQYPKQDFVRANVILDGVVLPLTLKAMGFDETWLCGQMRLQGYRNYSEIYLATLDRAGTLNLFPMTAEKKPYSPFD